MEAHEAALSALMEEAPRAVGRAQGGRGLGKEPWWCREERQGARPDLDRDRQPPKPHHRLTGPSADSALPGGPHKLPLSALFIWSSRVCICRNPGSVLSLFLFSLTQDSLRAQGLSETSTEKGWGGRGVPFSPEPLGADCWLTGVKVLLTRKHLYLPS